MLVKKAFDGICFTYTSATIQVRFLEMNKSVLA